MSGQKSTFNVLMKADPSLNVSASLFDKEGVETLIQALTMAKNILPSELQRKEMAAAKTAEDVPPMGSMGKDAQGTWKPKGQ